MPRTPDPDSLIDSLIAGAEKAAAALTGFDYNVDAEDFVLYELHRLIEEDRASFDDSEFRTLIDAGVRAHISENVELRAKLSGILRASSTGQTQTVKTVTTRIVNAIEDLDADLCNVGVVVRSYLTYLLSRLETLSQSEEPQTDDKIADAADLLFESTGDRDAAETALKILCGHRSPVCARILAHAVSEPLLDEDLEAQAFAGLKASWPLPRHYMFYNLQGHPHEDIPYRWFQLFVEVDELTTVELVLEEFRAHGQNPDYREDLTALLEVLHGCRDPELEDKILGTLNGPNTPPEVVEMLRKFVESHQPIDANEDNPWFMAAAEMERNRKSLQRLSE